MTETLDASLTDVHKVLVTTAVTLRSLVTGAPASALDFREAPGAWTPLQVLCHVTDGDVTDWMPRLDMILSSGESRIFTPFDREAGFRVYAGWSVEQVLVEFDRLRAANLARLAALDLQDSDLQRTGVPPGAGGRHRQAAAGLLGDARPGAHRADLAIARPVLRSARRAMAKVFQPAGRRLTSSF